MKHKSLYSILCILIRLDWCTSCLRYRAQEKNVSVTLRRYMTWLGPENCYTELQLICQTTENTMGILMQ